MSKNEGGITINLGGSGLGLLGVILVLAKLAGIAPVAAWSWWLVTAPFWGGFAILLAILFVPVIILTLLGLCGAIGACTIWAVTAARDRIRRWRRR